jgi:hypothetical protein
MLLLKFQLTLNSMSQMEMWNFGLSTPYRKCLELEVFQILVHT